MSTFLVGVLGLLAAACSDSPTTSGPPASPPAPTSTSSAQPGPGPASDTASCADFAGTCAAGSTCPAGTARVADGSATLCGSSSKSCCVPPGSGGVVRKADYGLVCTKDGDFAGPDGTCGGASCALGCACAAAGGAATCDCSRGLPSAAPKGSEVCALFSCGTITCGAGCHCSDAAQSACVCP